MNTLNLPRRHIQRNALAMALSLAVLATGQAFAQEQEVSATPRPQSETQQSETSAEDASRTLDTVVVTARKRVESIMEVPMNISVVTAEELTNRNLSNVQDIYRTIAGGSSPTGQLVLRGLVGGNTAVPGTTSQFVDGIPFGFGTVFDVESVEVLRGPQGTLWGSNAIGGTVQMRTRGPQFNDLELFTTVVGEQEKNVEGTKTRLQAGINIPLVDDTLAMRIAASTSHTPGKIVNAYTGATGDTGDEFLRTQLRWQPMESVDVTLGHIWTATDTTGTTLADRSIASFYLVPNLSVNPDSPWGYDVDFTSVDCPAGAERPACLATAPRVRSNPKYTIYELLDGWSRDTTNLYSLSASHDDLFGFMSATYIGSYRKNFSNSLDNWSRLDMEDMVPTWIVNRDSSYRTTHELRFQNLERTGGIDWTVGLFQDRRWSGYNPSAQWQYYNPDPQSVAIFSAWNDWAWPAFADLGITNTAQLGQALYGNPGINYNLTTFSDYSRERAAFGELSYLMDTGIGQFEFTGGVRFFEFEDSTAYQRSGIWFGTDENGSPYFNTEAGGEESGNRKKFSVSYMPNKDVNVFAVYSEGYRPGGNNAPLPPSCAGDEFAAGYKPRYTSDQIENMEVGFKAAMLDRRLRVSSAVYSIDWSDTWATVYMPSCGFQYTTNTPGESAKSQGVELESSLLLGDATTLTVNYGYTDSELTKDNPALQADAGDSMTMVPKYNAYVALDQGFELFGREAFARIDVAAYGEYKSHFNTRPEDVSPSYQTLNLSGRLHLNDNAVMSVHIDNVLNEEYLTYRSARSRSSTRSALNERYGAERSVAVRFEYTY